MMLSIFKNHSSDEQLLTGLRAGGAQRRAAENMLYEQNFYLIKLGAYKYSLPEEDAVSAYSDTIISVIENIVAKKFEGRASLKSYTHQIFLNKCVDLVRKATTNKNKVHQASDIDDLLTALPDKTKSIVERIIEKGQQMVLLQKMKEIGEKCRQLLLLFEDGYSDREIAAIMLYNSPDVVKTSRLRCLEKLKEKMVQQNN